MDQPQIICPHLEDDDTDVPVDQIYRIKHYAPDFEKECEYYYLVCSNCQDTVLTGGIFKAFLEFISTGSIEILDCPGGGGHQITSFSQFVKKAIDDIDSD